MCTLSLLFTLSHKAWSLHFCWLGMWPSALVWKFDSPYFSMWQPIWLKSVWLPSGWLIYPRAGHVPPVLLLPRLLLPFAYLAPPLPCSLSTYIHRRTYGCFNVAPSHIMPCQAFHHFYSEWLTEHFRTEQILKLNYYLKKKGIIRIEGQTKEMLRCTPVFPLLFFFFFG